MHSFPTRRSSDLVFLTVKKVGYVMTLTKKDIVAHLETIALYLELKGANSFRISAYRKAAQNIEVDIRSLKEIDDFYTKKGIGEGTNESIKKFIESKKVECVE